MKRLAFLTITFLFALSLVYVQAQTKETKKEQKSERVPLKKLEGNKVSKMAMESFKADFGDIPNAQWKRSGTFDEVIFKKDGKEMIANYDIEGKLVGTTQVVAFKDVPAKGQEEIQKKYKDYKIGTVFFYDDNEANETDMIMYGIQFDDEDNWFVEMAKGTDKIVVKVNKTGEVEYFKKL